MKSRCVIFILGLALASLFNACKPDFDLNAPYRDVPVVYGILNFQEDTNYVKIYKGFQPEGQETVYFDAQNPDNIYYKESDIVVVLQELGTNRPDIQLFTTNKHPKDSGFFYHGENRIIYYTTAPLNKDLVYNIKITNKANGNVTQGKTSLVGNFEIKTYYMNMVSKTSNVLFSKAKNAIDYEIHVNFLYYEVDKTTNQVVKTGKVSKNICPKVGGEIKESWNGDLYKEFNPSFYEDVAANLTPLPPNRVRYIGSRGANERCIELVGWAADSNLVNFILSNQPISSFTPINNHFTNLNSSEGLSFGFLSSRIKSRTTIATLTDASQDSLYFGALTRHLGFRPWTEDKY